MNAPAIEPLAVRQHPEGWWQCACRCGWNSRNIPFKDPDAAFHAGHLHLVLCREYGEGFVPFQGEI